MADAARRRGVPAELAVVALVAAACLPLTRLFAPGPLGNAVVATITASIVVSWAARRFRFPPMASWSASMLALLWFLAVYFFRDTLWGPFPSAETIGAIGDAIREGARQSAEEVAPVTPTEPLLVFVVGGVWMTTWLVDAAATWIRNPLLAVASAVPLFVLPGAIVESERLAIEVAVFVAAACAVLFVDQRRAMRRWGPTGADSAPGWRAGPAIRLAVVGAVLTAGIAPMLPGFGEPPGLQGRGQGAGVFFNPIVAIKPLLDSDIEQTLFTVQADRPTYYRLTSLDLFEGGVWQQRTGDPVEPALSGEVDVDAADSVPIEQRFTISSLIGPWLPAAYRPVSVAGHAPEVIPENATLLVDGELRAGMEYSVSSLAPRPESGTLDRPVSYDAGRFRRYLELPDSLPERVRDIALDVAGDEPNAYRQALAVQTHLRTFRYDEDIAATRSFDGLVEFLTEVQAGYCEQFAGSMAVLARALGIPSRVAIGFGFGYQRASREYQVTTRHAHAWVELFFPEAGWLAFEPTPRAGIAAVPPYAVPPNDNTDGGPDDTPTDAPTEQPSRSATDRPLEPEPPDPGGESPSEPKPFPWAIALAVMIGVLCVAAFIPSIPALVRRNRVANAPGPRAGVAARYVDFLEWCAAAGYGRRPGETPVEHTARLGKMATDTEPLERLAELMDEALWAPPDGIEPSDVAAATGEAKAVLTPTLTRTRRVRAALRWSGRGQG